MSQNLTPKSVRAQIARHNTTQIVVSTLAQVDNALFSLFLNGYRELPPHAHTNVARVFRFFEDLRGETDLPLDLSKIVELRPRWRRWCAHANARTNAQSNSDKRVSGAASALGAAIR